MKAYLAAVVMAAFASSACAGEQVWRYVDERTGQVSYSNVQIKGKKGEKVEIMAYPSAPAFTAPAPSQGPGVGVAGSPIPAEVLRQLKASEVGGRPPSGLPPLPSLPGASRAPFAAPSLAPTLAAPSAAPAQTAPAAPEPMWAKEVAPKTPAAPAWAQDPFAAPATK